MQLPIETWLTGAGLPEEANIAFREAVSCYKSGAYRAALLFSYLGWGLSLRRRILVAQSPPDISTNQWLGIGEKLRNEEAWERQVFDCIKMKVPAPVFNISDDLRRQVEFWRDRRNGCAHFRTNDIGSSYTETFWLFVRSNLAKLVPRGTRSALLEEVRKFFDPNQTPPDSDVRPLAELIGPSVDAEQLEDFFREVVQNFTSMSLASFREPIALFEGVFEVNQSQVVRSLASYLAHEPWLLVQLLEVNPSRVLNWANDRTLFRRLWREWLFEHGRQDLPVYAALLRNDLIPGSEIHEANSWVVARLNGDVPAAGNIETLLACGFVESLGRHTFEARNVNQFAWGNRNASVIRWLIETFPITSERATILCEVFKELPYPFYVRDALAALFSNNASKREELRNAAISAGVDVPDDLLAATR